ncbi:shikimate kinase [Mesoaciditoga sp.]
MRRNRVALIGMMGSGKSKVGEKLAGILGFKWIDMDEEFEKENGSISDFFKKHGESEFRKKEKELLKRVAKLEDIVISTGGGIVKNAENREILSSMQTFYLHCPVEILWKRVKESGRPLAESEKKFFSLFEKRKPFYERFKKVQTSDLNEWEVAAKIAKEMIVPSCVKIPSSFQKLVICDDFNFPPSDLTMVSENVKRIWEIEGIGVEDGETLKSISSVSEIWKMFLKHNLTRKSVVNAIGGGTVTDAVGFAAQTFMRGMNFNLLPTTLLGMVDAAVGGKFAFNFEGIKNVVGVFGTPDVFINPIFSLSLKEERFKEGIVEALKLGIVHDKELFDHIEMNFDSIIKREYESVKKLIFLATKDKLEIVEKDPYDDNYRHVLNFGHTIAHAIESESENAISHGHAVAIGMKVESKMFSPQMAQKIESVVQRLNFPNIGLASIKRWIDKDKKREGKYIVVPIIDEIGKSHIEKIKIEDILNYLIP